MINIHRRSPLTNELNAIEFSIDAIEFFNWCDTPKEFRPNLRSAFPSLTDADEDFIFYGVLPGEWESILKTNKIRRVKRWEPISRPIHKVA
jgi:hypothetical protein